MKRIAPVLVFLLGMAPGAMSQDPPKTSAPAQEAFNTGANAWEVFKTASFAQGGGQTASSAPDPNVAFLKSLVLPGWGHHYADPGDWTRGRYHLAGEAVLVLSYLGLSVHSGNLKQNWWAYGQAEAGVPIKGRSRGFQLAVGDFESLEAYNDYQARSRNWGRLYEDIPENRWQWRDRPSRLRYGALRHRFERIDQQLPALLVLMVVNRVISGISAYNRARAGSQPAATIRVSGGRQGRGMMAHLRIAF